MIDGPTPLEIARSPVGWWARSEAFYTSGEVLFNTREEYYRKYYNECVGKQKQDKCKDIRKLINIKTPIVFNLAFSIELLVKAILIVKDPNIWIPDKGRIKFGHNIYKLIVENIKIDMNENEIMVAKRIGDYVSYGKYPERVNPGDIIDKYEDLFNYNPYVSWNLDVFFEIISSLRHKLREYFLIIVKE